MSLRMGPETSFKYSEAAFCFSSRSPYARRARRIRNADRRGICLSGFVVPNAVGVDIGCGMCAVKNFAPALTEKSLKQIMSVSEKWFPWGLSNHQHKQDIGYMPAGNIDPGRNC
jgi:hypothetical protein